MQTKCSEIVIIIVMYSIWLFLADLVILINIIWHQFIITLKKGLIYTPDSNDTINILRDFSITSGIIFCINSNLRKEKNFCIYHVRLTCILLTIAICFPFITPYEFNSICSSFL